MLGIRKRVLKPVEIFKYLPVEFTSAAGVFYKKTVR